MNGPRFSAAGLLAVLAAMLDPAMLDGPVDAQAAPATCHGVRATKIGTPDAVLLGTRGRDVAVTNGARSFRGRGGDDLICVTGDAPQPSIWTSDGDDTDLVHQRFGLISFHGEGGSDVYRDRGKGNIDMVYVQAGGQDRISTGPQGDRLRLEPGGHHGRVQAGLGSGEDTFDVRVGRVHGTRDGGAGPDRLDIDHRSMSGTALRNRPGLSGQPLRAPTHAGQANARIEVAEPS